MKNTTATLALLLLACDGRAPAVDAPRLEIAAQEKRKDDFEKDNPKWKFAAGTWERRKSGDSTVLAQTADAQPWAVAILEDQKFADVDVTVRFRPISGKEDASGGIIFRAKDAKNYYLVRANGLEDNFRLYWMKGGSRKELASAKVDAPKLGDWHTMRVVAKGSKIQAYLNGKLQIDHDDQTYTEGYVGLWTKADSVTEFDDLEIARGLEVTGLLLVLLLSQASPELVQTIPLPKVEGRIDHLALDPKSQKLAVAALGNNTVDVIDLAAGKVAHTISGLQEPQGVVFWKGELVVASGGDGSCRFYDGESYKQAKSIDCKGDADNVRVDAAGGRIYVGYGDGGLAILDPEKGVKVGEIKLAGHPESFQLESKGHRIFVNVPRASHIAVVDRDKGAVIATWKLSAQSNFPMALDEDAHRLYVGCRQPSRLLAFDTESGKELSATECSGDTDDVFLDAASKRVFVSCGAGFLDVFSVADAAPKRISKIPTAAGARTCLYVPDLHRLFLAVPHRVGQPAEIRVYKTE